eukprot:2295480-Lingulodinium_polyedra.AAC.1
MGIDVASEAQVEPKAPAEGFSRLVGSPGQDVVIGPALGVMDCSPLAPQDCELEVRGDPLAFSRPSSPLPVQLCEDLVDDLISELLCLLVGLLRGSLRGRSGQVAFACGKARLALSLNQGSQPEVLGQQALLGLHLLALAWAARGSRAACSFALPFRLPRCALARQTLDVVVEEKEGPVRTQESTSQVGQPPEHMQ